VAATTARSNSPGSPLQAALDLLGLTQTRLARVSGSHLEAVSAALAGRRGVPPPVLDLLDAVGLDAQRVARRHEVWRKRLQRAEAEGGAP